MLLLILGLTLFFLVHLVPTVNDLKHGLVARLGPGGYKAVFGVLSFVGLALIVVGYGKLQMAPGKNPVLWYPPTWTRHLAFLLMLPAVILLVAAYVPSRIRSAVKHPMLVAIKIWALAHLLANGDLASLLLFGSFLAYAVYDRISARQRAALGPLGSRAGGPLNDIVVVVLGAAIYTFFLFFGHAWLIRAPLLPG
jgi:uncharacterized membrane protein